MEKKSAIVTGGASGIGRACVEWLVEHGYEVWCADFDFPDDAQQELQKQGVHTHQCDVRIETQVTAVVADVQQKAKRLDVLVNNAGVGCVAQITDVSEADWDRCIDTNLKGAFLFCKHGIALMKATGGAIVNIASNAGILPRIHDPVYCVSKAGLIMLTKALALSHARDRIRVNAVCPGPVAQTRMMEREVAEAADPEAYRAALIAASPLAQAFGRMATPDEIAQSVGYLCSDAAAMVSGTIIAIDGAKSVGVPPK